MLRKEDQALPYDEVVKPELRYYVYSLWLPHKNNPVYIGKGTERRYLQYSYGSRISGGSVSNHILRSKLKRLRDVGEKYKVLILFETDDQEEALDAEEFYINYFGRLFNGSGILYNFESAGRVGQQHAEWNQKKIYFRGFVFPSIGKACEVMGVGRTTITRSVVAGHSITLDKSDDEIFGFVDPLTLPENCGPKPHHNSRGIIIDSVHYQSLESAARAFNYSGGHSLLYFLENVEHNHEYQLLSKGNPKGRKSTPIMVDGVLYKSLADAGRAYGYSTGTNFKRFLTTVNHSHTYEILED